MPLCPGKGGVATAHTSSNEGVPSVSVSKEAVSSGPAIHSKGGVATVNISSQLKTCGLCYLSVPVK